MKAEKTNRGFNRTSFKDRRGIECSVQKSSLATDDCIWLGADTIGLQEFFAYRKPDSWVSRPEFDEHTMEHHFVANNRMELTRSQVAELLPILQRFVDTGDID